MSLGELIASRDSTITEIAERMGIGEAQVMAWVCGEVPDAVLAARLSNTLDVSLEELYAAVLRTPKII